MSLAAVGIVMAADVPVNDVGAPLAVAVENGVTSPGRKNSIFVMPPVSVAVAVRSSPVYADGRYAPAVGHENETTGNVPPPAGTTLIDLDAVDRLPTMSSASMSSV